MDWRSARVLVTGGASFIGSHLVDSLVELGAGGRIRVVDDLSSGRPDNVRGHVDSGAVELVRLDLLAPGASDVAVAGMDVVFHLANVHGGRGFVELHQAECSRNLAMDSLLIQSSHRAGVQKLVFASSGCVYPLHLQQDRDRVLFLTEDMVGPPYQADGMYGWAKLMTELSLKAYYDDFGFRSASCRFFTVYGERGIENHALLAMAARAFVGEDPFEVWGDGTQVRNWTYVGDIVRGFVLAAERIDDGTAVNLGTTERIRVIDAVHEVLRYTGHRAEVRLRTDMPTGPMNRVASNDLARELLGWEPKVRFADGIRRTVDWYFADRDRDQVRRDLQRLLTERGPEPSRTAVSLPA